MNRCSLLLVVVSIACARSAPVTSASPAATVHANDLATARAEITPLFERMLAAANAHDVDRHLAYYARSPDLVFMINDEVVRGFDTLRQRQREWWLDGKTDVAYSLVGEPRFVMPAGGVVVQTYVLASRRSAPGAGTREGRIGVTTMWQQRADGWRIVYAQEASAPAPAAASAASTNANSNANDVRAARIAQNAAIARLDTAAVARYWTDDVEIRRGLGALVVGSDNYKKLFNPDSAAVARGDELIYQRIPDRIDVSPAWPLAYEEGTWVGHLHTADGPSLIGGRYAAQWVKRGNSWLIRGEVYVALTCSGAGCESKAVP